MKVAITGHTRGIGAEIHKYFSDQGHECIGFSRANGHDITNIDDRKKIVEAAADCDVFVNNACSLTDDSQFELLSSVHKTFFGKSKIIINLSSVAGDMVGNNYYNKQSYARQKEKLDNFCKLRNTYNGPWIINLKPGYVNTDNSVDDPSKVDVDSISYILDFILASKDRFKVRSITFGK